MKAKVIETGEIVDVVSVIDKPSGHFVSYWDEKTGKTIQCLNWISMLIPKQIMRPPKPIDWEQRRYEIAKDVLARIPITNHNYLDMAVYRADTLIEKLKR